MVIELYLQKSLMACSFKQMGVNPIASCPLRNIIVCYGVDCYGVDKIEQYGCLK